MVPSPQRPSLTTPAHTKIPDTTFFLLHHTYPRGPPRRRPRNATSLVQSSGLPSPPLGRRGRGQSLIVNRTWCAGPLVACTRAAHGRSAIASRGVKKDPPALALCMYICVLPGGHTTCHTSPPEKGGIVSTNHGNHHREVWRPTKGYSNSLCGENCNVYCKVPEPAEDLPC